jgi:outer membrane biogenesis lipoprotein LolB
MRAVRHTVLALSVLLIATCSSDGPSEPTAPSIDGTWASSQAGIVTNVTLTGGTGGPVTGSGNVIGSGVTVPVTVTGTYSPPNVTLSIQAPGAQNLSFEGQFSGSNTITGTLNGSGLTNFPYALQRQ